MKIYSLYRLRLLKRYISSFLEVFDKNGHIKKEKRRNSLLNSLPARGSPICQVPVLLYEQIFEGI